MCNQREIKNYHHIVPRTEGGSNTVDNIAGLCLECHEKVHKNSDYIKKLQKLKKGLKKQYAGTSILNTIVPRIVREIEERYPEIELKLTTGYETKKFREEITDVIHNTKVRAQNIENFKYNKSIFESYPKSVQEKCQKN